MTRITTSINREYKKSGEATPKCVGIYLYSSNLYSKRYWNEIPVKNCQSKTDDQLATEILGEDYFA